MIWQVNKEAKIWKPKTDNNNNKGATDKGIEGHGDILNKNNSLKERNAKKGHDKGKE